MIDAYENEKDFFSWFAIRQGVEVLTRPSPVQIDEEAAR